MQAPEPPAHAAPPSPPPAKPEPRAFVRWVGVADAAALVLVLASLAAPHVPASPLVAYLVAFTAVAASVVATALATPRLTRAALPAVLAAVALLVLVHVFGLARGANVAGAALVTISLLLGGTCLGAVVGGRIEHPGHLLVVAIVFTLADSFSVFHEAGPTAAIVASETMLPLVALPWPQLGAETPTIAPLLGVGDVVAAALFAAVARRHGLSLGRTAVALFVGLELAMALVVTMARPIPALPTMALAILVAHPEARRLRPADRRQALLGLAVLALVLVAFRLLNR
jgi:hypothetical protein